MLPPVLLLPRTLPACPRAAYVFCLSASTMCTRADCFQQTCINNLLGLSPSFGCPSAEASCLCAEPNFGYGVRDCSNEACGNADVANQVISYGLAYCARKMDFLSPPRVFR